MALEAATGAEVAPWAVHGAVPLAEALGTLVW